MAAIPPCLIRHGLAAVLESFASHGLGPANFQPSGTHRRPCAESPAASGNAFAGHLRHLLRFDSDRESPAEPGDAFHSCTGRFIPCQPQRLHPRTAPARIPTGMNSCRAVAVCANGRSPSVLCRRNSWKILRSPAISKEKFVSESFANREEYMLHSASWYF